MRSYGLYGLSVEGIKISLKTETGIGTKSDSISITKLCTTEREPWDAPTLKGRALEHLSRYDVILMLRTIWTKELVRYQLVDIPVSLLRLLANCEPVPVGKRTGRQSLGADVFREGHLAFHVHFDGSDGKCQIRGLRVADCKLLQEWKKKRQEQAITRSGSIFGTRSNSNVAAAYDGQSSISDQ